MTRSVRLLFLIGLVVVLLAPGPAHAYVGPGAGIAIATSAWTVLVAFCSAGVLLLTWPLRLLWRALFGGRGW